MSPLSMPLAQLADGADSSRDDVFAKLSLKVTDSGPRISLTEQLGDGHEPRQAGLRRGTRHGETRGQEVLRARPRVRSPAAARPGVRQWGEGTGDKTHSVLAFVDPPPQKETSQEKAVTAQG